MQWEQMQCPECGGEPFELAENCPAQAGLMNVGTAAAPRFEYAGGSRMISECQEPIVDSEGRHNLWCCNGHEWWTRPLADSCDTFLIEAAP